ncbi:MAG TPA: hypothetical protein VHH36_07215 [Candidatus Thermoplasmatota archaeon]|nr:hypothetical protein [Candidatus Thermoplasmatota archaeon]
MTTMGLSPELRRKKEEIALAIRRSEDLERRLRTLREILRD